MGATLTMFQTFSQNAQSQHFRFGHCFIWRGSVRKHTRELRHLRQPSAIFLAFTFNVEVQGTPLHSEWKILRLARNDAQRLS